MITALFEKPTFAILQNSLDADMKRHELIANNIANVNTPGFKRSDVVFADRLQDALTGQGVAGRQSRDRHIPIGRLLPQDVKPSIITEELTHMRNDENNVDVDKEMAELAKTQLHYRALVQAMQGEAGKISSVISGGGRV
jgi:flagellar basal-body rod protein FlgB